MSAAGETRVLVDKNGMRREFHGHYQHPIYATWLQMRFRCYSKTAANYAHYGARGIVVCDRWHSFVSFLEDMGNRPSPKHSVERIDNDGPYSPDNWATNAEQHRNMRSNHMLIAFGETKCIADWALDARCTVSVEVLRHRARRGWSAERTVATPLDLLRSHRKSTYCHGCY